MELKHARYGVIAMVLSFLLLFFQNMTTANLGKKNLEGELEIIHVDNRDSSSKYLYYLKGNNKERTLLKFNNKAPTTLRTGAQIKVQGELSGNVLALDSSSGSVQVLASPAPNTFGVQKTAVFLVNFQDNVVQPYTVSQLNSVVFGEANNFIKENSFQQTSMSGNVFGWYTLPMAQTCDFILIRDQVLQTVAAMGVDVNAYQRHIIVFPKNSTCTWAGLGTVGGSPSTAWLNGLISMRAVSHEFGHNLGLWHSHSLECGTTVLGSSCTKSEYGDWFDTMGGGEPTHYNAFQKENLGWLNYGTSPSIVTVENGSAMVTIEPYAATTLGIKAVKVLKSVDATTGAKTWYYLEYRQAINLDSPLINRPGTTSGPLVHLGTEGNGDTSLLLDMTPASNSNIAYDWNDSPLPLGIPFTDSGGVTLTLLSADSRGATVSVSTSGTNTPVCIRSNPSVTISPAAPGAVLPETPVAYVVSVKNNDNSICSSSTFNLGSVVPSGFSFSFSSSSLSLAPGASGDSTLTVASGSSSAAGSYNISVSAVNGAANSYIGSGTATYSVASNCTMSNPTVILMPTTSSSAYPGTTLNYTMAVKNNNNSACSVSTYSLSFSVPSGWNASLASTSVSLASGASANINFAVTSPLSSASGNYLVATSASVGAYSASASSNYSVVSLQVLSISVGTDKLSYSAGNTVSMTANVMLGGVAASGLNVTFSISDPNGKIITGSATTGSNGNAIYKYKLSRKPAKGIYNVKANVSSGTQSASGTASFTVP